MDSDLNNSFVLFFPFKVHPTHFFPINYITENYIHDRFSINLQEVDDYYVMTVKEFDTFEQAHEYAQFLWVGFMKVSLEHGIFYDFNIDLEVRNANNRIEGTFFQYSEVFMGSGLKNAYIFESKKSPTSLGTKHGYVRLGADISTIYLTIFNEKLNNRYKDILEYEKLKLALELYNSHALEPSPHSRFLLLVMGMEVLLPKEEKHEIASEFLSNWIVELDSVLTTIEPYTEKYSVLESLKRDLDFRRYKSLRSSLKNLVIETLQGEMPKEEVQSLAKQVVKVYDSRSQLVHNGVLPSTTLKQMEILAKDILCRILLVKVNSLINQ